MQHVQGVVVLQHRTLRGWVGLTCHLRSYGGILQNARLCMYISNTTILPSPDQLRIVVGEVLMGVLRRVRKQAIPGALLSLEYFTTVMDLLWG